MSDPRPASLDPISIAKIEQLAATVASHDGVDPLNEPAHLALTDRSPATHLVLNDESEELIGYASLIHHTAYVMVHPAQRCRGYGRGLVDAVLRQDQTARFWAFANAAGAQALAQAAGLQPIRELLQLRLDPAAFQRRLTADAPATPPNITIRSFRLGTNDESAWVVANAAAFANHPEQGQITEVELQARIAEPWFDASGFWLAISESNELLGFHWTKREAQQGEVYVLGIIPSAAGQGLGTVLLDQGLRSLAEQGASEVELYVEADNTAARRLYEKAGFALARRDVMYAAVPLPAESSSS